ncbi:MAG: HAD family hydrolase [Deltaproteobacteria bacterium]|nr:HAD family hydrolase [Deltaproteobacteria bacterium]
MFTIGIPGGKTLELDHLVLDYNGTIALDGDLLPGVPEMIHELTERLKVHVLTANTHGTVAEKLEGLACRLHVIPAGHQDQAKRDYIRRLGCNRVAAIGNGRNDALMLEEAALGIGVLQAEGASPAALQAAGVVCHSIRDALNLFVKPARLKATLRN